MFGIFADMFRVATRNEPQDHYEGHKERIRMKMEQKRLHDKAFLTRYRGW